MVVRSLMGLADGPAVVAEARRPAAAAIGSVMEDVESDSEPVGTTSVVSTSAAEVARIVAGGRPGRAGSKRGGRGGRRGRASGGGPNEGVVRA